MIHVGPAFILFGSIAAALALVTYLYMESENRFEATERKAARKHYLAEEYYRLKDDLGLDPDSVIDNENEYYALCELIENGPDVSDEDRRDLVAILDTEFKVA